MRKVEIEEYSKSAEDSFHAEREYFKTRRETLNLIYTVLIKQNIRQS